MTAMSESSQLRKLIHSFQSGSPSVQVKTHRPTTPSGIFPSQCVIGSWGRMDFEKYSRNKALKLGMIIATRLTKQAIVGCSNEHLRC